MEETGFNCEDNSSKDEIKTEPETAKAEKNAPMSREVPFKRHWSKQLIMIVIIAAVVCLALIPGLSKKKAASKPVVFVKDNGLYVYDVENGIVCLSDNMGETSGYSLYFFGYGNTYSDDLKVMHYRSNIDSDGKYTLSKVSITDFKTIAEIDTDVLNHAVSADGSKAAYIKLENGNLALYADNGTDKFKIRDGVGSDDYFFQLSRDGKNIYYLETTENGTKNCYKCDITGENKALAAEDVGDFAINYNNELVYCRYNEDGTGELYISKNGADTLITDDLAGVRFLENNKGFVYLENGDNTVSVWDIVVDDMAETDKEMKAPVFAEYGHERKEEYLEASSAYTDKEKRDVIREELNSIGSIKSGYDLYLYDETGSSLLAENIMEVAVFGENGEYIMASEALVGEDSYKILLSELTSAAEVEYLYGTDFGKTYKTYIVSKNGKVPVEAEYADIVKSVYDDKDGNIMLATYTDPSNGTFKPVILNLSKGSVAKYTYIEDYVNYIDFYGDGKAAYVTAGGNLCTTETGGENIYDTGVNYMCTNEDDYSVYYINNMDNTSYTGTLKRLKNGQCAEIDTGVSYVDAIKDGKVVYIKNYDEASGKGDLYIYSEIGPVLINEGVTCVMDLE